MNDSDLIALAERERQRLIDENDHSAATIVGELVERLRDFSMAHPEAKNARPYVTRADLERAIAEARREIKAETLAAVTEARRTNASVRQIFR